MSQWWVVVIATVTSCVPSDTGPAPAPYNDCDTQLISSPTSETSYATTEPVLALGGIAASENCDVPDHPITVTLTNKTTGQSETSEATPRCEQICPFTGCTGKFYYWYDAVDLVPLTNQVEVRSSTSRCDRLSVTYTPTPHLDAGVDAPPDAQPPRIQITSPSTTHQYTTSATSIALGGTCATGVDGLASLTSDRESYLINFFCDPTWTTYQAHLVVGVNRLTVRATFSGVAASDYIDVTYAP